MLAARWTNVENTSTTQEVGSTRSVMLSAINFVLRVSAPPGLILLRGTCNRLKNLNNSEGREEIKEINLGKQYPNSGLYQKL